MSTLVLGAALAGLAGSPHCIGMCGGFAAAASDAPAAYHAGRVGTYVILGALAGGMGDLIPGPSWVATGVSAVLVIWFAGRLAGLIPAIHAPAPSGGLADLGRRFLEGRGALARAGLGATSALLPCGLVWTALGLAVGAGGPAQGGLTMLAFGAGTVPLLGGVALGVRRLTARSRSARLGVAAAVLAAGLFGLYARWPAPGAEVPTCHQP